MTPAAPYISSTKRWNWSNEKTRPNVETYIVAFRAPDQSRHRLWFNVVTSLLMREVVTRETPIGVIPQQTDFEQWQDSGGTAFPMRERTSLVDPWAGSTRQYTDVTIDAKIDDAVFAKPK